MNDAVYWELTESVADTQTHADTSASTFEHGCAVILRDPGQQPRHRQLIQTLKERGVLPILLGDASYFDLREAAVVAQTAMEESRGFDDDLIQFIKSARVDAPDSINQAVRLLSVLESVCAPDWLVLRLLDLKHSEARICSKVTLILGRLTGSPKWLRARLKDKDPRIRANAIESLWNVRTVGLDEVLLEAARDPHHRIAANAALGLYKLGDVAAVRILYSMLRHQDELFRRAALWAIDQVPDSRYLAIVENIAAHSHSEEQSAAERVLKHLRNHSSATRFVSSLSLEITGLKKLQKGITSARLHCLAGSSSHWLAPSDLNALDFVVSEGENQVEEFSFRPVDPEGPMVAVLITPDLSEGCAELIRSAWAESGETEGLSIISQLPSPHMAEQGSGEALEFKFGHEIQLSLTQFRTRHSMANTLDRAVESGLRALSGMPGKRYLFVIANPNASGAISSSVIAFASQTHIPVHAIVSDIATHQIVDSLKLLAERTGGRVIMARTVSRMIHEVLSVRACHFGSFEISWRAETGSSLPVTISCSNSYGFGEGVRTNIGNSLSPD